MRNNKAQALIEFILIIPILIMILLACIDFGNIYFTKNKMENLISDAVTMIENNKTYDEVYKELKKRENITKLEYIKEKDYLRVIIEIKVDILTPGLNLALGNPHKITTERLANIK